MQFSGALSRLVENNKKIIVLLFFLGFLFVGLRIYGDYGVHWDEYNNQGFGERWGRYILAGLEKGSFHGVKVDINKNHDWIHGPVFELFLKFAEKKLFHLSDSRDIIFMRHLLTFLLFYIAVFVFYLLCNLYFRNWKISLLGSLFLVLHPRIFSHSFYNSVDIPLLSFYVISTYILIRYLDKKTCLRAAFHALTCAILIDIRLAGVILPFFTLVFLAVDIIRLRKDREEIKKIIKTIIVYVLLLISLTVLFWPLLWGNPIGNFFKALNATLKFRRLDIPISPWYYNFKWIIITTPLLYTFCFFVGCFISIKDLFRNPIKLYPQNRPVLIAMFLFFVPIMLPIIYKGRLYDGWRHFYFIYPIFVIFSLMSMAALYYFIKEKFKGLGYKFANSAFILIIAISLADTVWFMIKYHPHQCVYANILGGRDMRQAKERFALDYWGLSYREALEYILKNDESESIKVCVANSPGWNNANILPPRERSRLVYVKNLDEADYFLGNYRSSGEYQWAKGEYPDKKEYYSIKVGEVKFMVVYKLKE